MNGKTRNKVMGNGNKNTKQQTLSGARAPAGAQHEGEGLYRNLFNNMAAGFALHEILCDESGNPVDYRFLNVNPTFEKLTGLRSEQVVGKSAREVLPGIEKEDWIEKYGRVALTGEPCRFENFSSTLDRWYEVFAYRPADMQFAVIFSDVTERKRTEERIKDAARFPLENPLPVLRIRRDGKVIFANPASDILLHEWGISSTGSVPEGWKRAIRIAMEMQESKIIEGKIRDIEFSFHIVPVGGSDYVNVYGSNVTHLKEVQDELKKHKEHLEEQVKTRTRDLSLAYEELRRKQESLTEAQRIGRMGNWEWNIATNELLWSDEIYRIFGFKPQAFRATYDTFLKSVHPDDREFVTESVNRALDQGKPYSIDHRIVLPDAAVRIIHEQAELVRDGDGKAIRMVGTVQDVTEQRKAEEAANVERRRLLDVLEMLPVYVVLLAPDYQVPFKNRFFRERFGDSHGRRCFEYLFNRSAPCETCETFTVMKTGAPHEWEWTSPDRGVFHVFDFPFRDSEGATFVLEMGIEITARKLAENELKERKRQLEMLSRKVLTSQEDERKQLARELHDSLGQKIIAMQLEIEWLKNRETGSAEKNAYENMIGLTVDVSDELHQICMGLRPLVLDKIGFAAAVKELLEEFESKSDVVIDARIKPVDETRIGPGATINLYRILQEALTNIIRHSNTKTAFVALHEEDSELVLDVKDEGCGLPEDESSRRYNFGVLGMRERANMSGGHFEMNSAPGKGTRIRVSIPVGKSVEEHGNSM